MNIQPYSVLMTNDNTFIFVEGICKRKLTDAINSNDIIVTGTLFKHKVGLEGDNTKHFLNIKTATFKQIKRFVNQNSSSCHESSWVYLHEIKAIVNRDPIVFSIDKELEIV